jgi:hypothetical protein
MRLTRNATPDGKCKYALVRLDKLRAMKDQLGAGEALFALEQLGLIDYGEPGTENEFFALKLKDENAANALDAYAEAAGWTDEELSEDVTQLAERARYHPSRHRPD